MIINVHFALFIYLIRAGFPPVLLSRSLTLTHTLSLPLYLLLARSLFLSITQTAFAWASHRFWVNNIVDCNDKLQLNFCCNEGRPEMICDCSSYFCNYLIFDYCFAYDNRRAIESTRNKTFFIQLRFDFALKCDGPENGLARAAAKNDELKNEMI